MFFVLMTSRVILKQQVSITDTKIEVYKCFNLASIIFIYISGAKRPLKKQKTEWYIYWCKLELDICSTHLCKQGLLFRVTSL